MSGSGRGRRKRSARNLAGGLLYFVKAFTALAATRDDTNVSAWLHRIAANACLDVLRHRQLRRWLPWHGPTHDHLLLSAPADATASLITRGIPKPSGCW